MVSVHSLCTRLLQLKSITQTTNQVTALENHAPPLPVTLPAHTTLYEGQPPASRGICNLPSPLVPQRVSYFIHVPPLHSFQCIHLSSLRYPLMISVQRFTLKAQPKRKPFSITVYNETKTQNSESIEFELKAIAARSSLLGTWLVFTLPASVYFNPTFSSVSFVFGGGQTAWSLPGVLSSCSVGLWSGYLKSGQRKR